jgi:hypothetical protein
VVDTAAQEQQPSPFAGVVTANRRDEKGNRGERKGKEKDEGGKEGLRINRTQRG